MSLKAGDKAVILYDDHTHPDHGVIGTYSGDSATIANTRTSSLVTIDGTFLWYWFYNDRIKKISDLTPLEKIIYNLTNL